jgi:tRNA threonylcarbamoyladenosine biosynthesis protein TsaE
LIEKKSPAPKYKSAPMVNQKIDIMTHSVDETRKLGHQIGTLIKKPLVIALIGDLGSGKTAFVQGLAKGLEVPDGFYITSPTFTLVNEYPGRYPLVHVDLYRLENISDLADIGLDEMLHGQAVLAIEWADKLSDGLPAEHLLIRLEVIDDDCRILSLNATGHNKMNLILALEDAWSE